MRPIRAYRFVTLGLVASVATTLVAGVGVVAQASSFAATHQGVSSSPLKPLAPSSRVHEVDCSVGFLTLTGPGNVSTVADRVTCYRLTVPQDRSRPKGPLTPVSVGIAVIEPVGGATSRDPVLAIAGGVIKGVPRLMGQFFGPPVGGVAQVERLAPGRRIIVVDSRGAGTSTPQVQCDGVGFTNSLIFPTATAVEACKAKLAAERLALENFTAPRFAEDLVQIRREFGIHRWNVYGISAGAAVALELVRIDARAVRTLSMDGVSAVTQGGFSPAYRVNPILATFDECAADAACHAAYPDLDTDFEKVLSSLPDDPTFPDTRGLSRQRFGSAVRAGVEYYGLRELIPSLVHAAAAGDFSGFPPFADAYDEIYPQTLSDEEVFAPELTTLAYFCTHEASPQRIAGRLGTEPTYRPVADVVLESVPNDMPEIPRICAGLGVGKGPIIETRPVRSAVRALLLNGVNDTATPEFWATEVARTLRRSQSVRFPSTGHTPTIEQFDCAADLIAQHIHGPSRTVDATCADALPATPWVL